MQELLDELLALRSTCDEACQRLSKKHALAATEPPIEGLGICFNGTTVAAELVSYYKATWEALPMADLDAATVKNKRGENNDRLVLIGKSNFILGMSGLEFAAKNANAKFPNVLGFKEKRIYLRDIINESTTKGLVDANSSSLWQGAIKIRNCLVHNNGLADETAKWLFASDLTIEMNEGDMLTGTMMTMPRLTRWMVSAFADWGDRFLHAHGR
jgi:hypothetical protein